MDINDIFKETVASTTLNGGKRKVAGAPSMRELKEGGYGIVEGDTAAAKRARPEAGDRTEVDDEVDDGADDEVDDDEGGRFFSDGLTAGEKDVMSWVDHMEEMDAALDHAAVQRLVVRLERTVSKNTKDRIAHAQNPEGFAESEAELDEAIQRLLLLANDVHYLRVLDELDALPTLVGLLAHENVDIALDVVQLLVELTAEDAWSHEGESQEERAAVVAFITALARHELFEMLGQNLRRLNEASESSEGDADRQGVFQTLALVENLVSLDIVLAEQVVAAMELSAWLCARIATSYSRNQSQADPNQQYAAEVTSILLQASVHIRERADSKLMDSLLQCLAKYRKHTPDDEIAMEYLENIVDSMSMLLSVDSGKQAFFDYEGVELLVLMQKQQQIGRLLSLKILDYALTPAPTPKDAGDGEAAGSAELPRAIAKRYIDGMGLKYLTSILMRRGKGAMQKLYKKHPEADERAVNCIAWLLRLTDQGTPLHWRVLAKFVPSPADPTSWKAYVDRIVELNVAYGQRVEEAQEQSGSDDESGDGDVAEQYLRRMDAGLFTLQMTGIAVAFIAEEDSQARERIERQLKQRGRSMAAVHRELAEYIEIKEGDTLGAATASGRTEDLAGILRRLQVPRET
ncbi:hypothetical protein GGF46_002840 [Coemansia sp. RSA 552]|nr:hypothetical protein GGF46_002840 [Coemansia sp. RSA 552]